MTETPTCPTCRAPIPAGSPGGACPRCLLAAGLEDAAAPPAPEAIARDFPAYDVLEVLGQGGMGVVYKARQKNLDRLVALKVLPPDVAREPGFAERFLREARTLALLQHPHVVAVHDFGETNGLFYLVMEYVDGPNLREAIRDGGLTPRQALAIVPQICDALQYAHDRGVVHRDVKPENVLLDRAGNVKIADFGLAKIVRRSPVDVTLTRAGQVMGTVHYMAPEQYREPDAVDHRADIYSLGVVFYEMLTGELPLGTFPRPSSTQGVDSRLDDVVLRALERDRERRWQHASEVRTRVDGIAATEGKAPAPSPAGPRLSRLAVVGALTVPAGAMLAAILFLLADAFAPPGRGNALGTGLVMTFGAAVVLTGLLVSMIAVGAIRRSRGALYGMGWAVAGCVLPLTIALVFFALLLVRDSAVRQEGAIADRVRMDVEVRAFWHRDRAEMDRDRPFDERARFLAPSERRAFDEMSKAERNDAAGAGRLGIPFLHPADPLTTFEVVHVALDPSRTRGRTVLTNGKWTLAFPVAYEEGRWHAAMGPVELMPRPPQAGDEKGWVDDWYFGRGDLADRVSGVPGMSAGERHRHAQAMHNLWVEHGNDVVPVNATGIAREFRVYHLHLEAPDSGRLVLSDGRSTIVVPVRTLADVWALGDEIVQSRLGAAEPGDRDGFLLR